MISRRRLLVGSAALTALPRAIPPTLAATMAAQAFSLTAAPAKLRLSETVTVDGLAFGGPEPVKTIRLRKGEPATIRLRNGLAEPLSLEWRGLLGCGAFADPMVVAGRNLLPGEVRTIPLPPLDSGTAWLRASPDPSNQAARGLRGLLIVEDGETPAVDEDMAILLADWLLSAEQRLLFGSTAPTAATVLFTTNGEPAPAEITRAPRARLRLRLVNASVQRVMLVACEGGRPKIVAVDGKPSDMFEPVRDTVPIGPGASFDYIVDMPDAPGAVMRLVLKASERVDGQLEPDRPLLTIRTAGAANPAKPPIRPLAADPALPLQIALESAKRAELIIDGVPGTASAPPQKWTVNGISGSTLPREPVLKVRQGDAVTLGFTNKTPTTVPICVGGHALRLLHSRDDGWEPYWRESVLLPPMSRNHVAFIAGKPGHWPIAGGFDDLTLAGLRCWFEVTPR